MVDQNAALGLIDELRVAVPEEVRAAKRINSEGERIIEKAQEEAERIVARAQEQAAFLIDERGLTQAAEAESRRMIAEAHEDGGAHPRRRRRVRGERPRRARGRRHEDPPEHPEGHRDARRPPGDPDGGAAAEDGETGDFKDGDWDDEAEDAVEPARS